MEFIQLKEVGKSFGKAKILENVNLSINEGEIVGIIGQSGSGKTTLLNLIGGFLQPTAGEITYVSKADGQPKNLHKNFHKIKKHIGYTPQHTSFYPKLTIMENLLHFGRMYGLDKNIILGNANGLLNFVGLENHHNKLGEHLSGGMKKRLDLSCSLIHKPKLLILDEPTADLDPLAQEEIINLIHQVNSYGITVVIASHHLDSLERICTKVVVLHNGTVRSQGEMEEIVKPYLKDNFTLNVRTGKEKERIIQLVKKLPVTKIVDQGHQLSIQSARPEQALLALMKIIKDEKLYLYDLDLRKPSLKEVLTKISENEPGRL